MGDGEPGQPPAAGHQDGGSGAARQQRRHLLGVRGVVQHDQHPPVREQSPVEPGQRLLVSRRRSRIHAERADEQPERGGRRQRPAGRGEAAKIQVELPLREPVRVAMGPVQGQRGLSDPAGAADRAHRDRTTGPRARRQGPVEYREFFSSSGEPRCGGG